MGIVLKTLLIYLIGGPVILCLVLRMFGAEVKFWQPIAAAVLAALCTLVVPHNIQSLVSFAVMVGFLRYFTQAEWGGIIFSAVISNAVLIGLLLAFAASPFGRSG